MSKTQAELIVDGDPIEQPQTDLAGGLIAAAELAAIVKLDETAQAAQRQIAEAEEKDQQTLKAAVMARAMVELRNQLQSGPLMADLQQLAGTPVGFVTDKEYGPDVIRDAAIVALIKGFRLVDNEWNIIAARFYPAKAGVRRILKERCGATDLQVAAGVPEAAGKRWLVPGFADWTLNGKAHHISRNLTEQGDYRMTLPLYETDKPSTVNGKAEATLLKMVWAECLGTDLDDLPEGGAS